MKRCEFYIRVRDHVEKRKGYRYEFGDGWYFIHREPKYRGELFWRATEPATGYILCDAHTRDELLAKIPEYDEKLMRRYIHGSKGKQAWYHDTADEYARLVKRAEEREADEQL